MTGIHVRVKRDGEWVTKEIEHLSDKEREEFLKGKGEKEFIRWINVLCNVIRRAETLIGGE